jgi:hypothetical protein
LVEFFGCFGNAGGRLREFGADGRVPEVQAAVGVVEAGFEAVVGAVAQLVEGGPESWGRVSLGL